ncbi:hypothetical protein BJ742DRAFT_833611 [Cladochytrium replicatum]|nr:hypothetical protein BJ742DRAFT_833611 [Cladochytrium replicatum]
MDAALANANLTHAVVGCDCAKCAMADQTQESTINLTRHFNGKSALSILTKAEEYEWDLLRKMQAKCRSIMEARAEQRKLLEQVINDMSPRTASSRSNHREVAPADSSESFSRQPPHANGIIGQAWEVGSSVDQLSSDGDPNCTPSKRPKESNDDAFRTPSKRPKQSNGFSGSSVTLLPGSERPLHGDMIKLYLNSPQNKRFKMYAYPDVPVAEVMEAIREGGLEFDQATFKEIPVREDGEGGNKCTLEDFGVRNGSTLDLHLSS